MLSMGSVSLAQHVARRIQALLDEQNISGSELARRIDVSQTYIWRRLSGEVQRLLDGSDRFHSSYQRLKKPGSGVLVSLRPSTYRGGTPRPFVDCGLADRRFEHPELAHSGTRRLHDQPVIPQDAGQACG